MRDRFWLLLALSLVFAACGGSSDTTGSTTVPESTTTTETPATTVTSTTTVSTTTIAGAENSAAIAVVLSALDAKNSFDLDGWLAAFEGGERKGIPLHAEEILMNANQHWEVVEPCQVTGTTASGETIVECLIRDITDFWGVGGISDTKLQRFTVNPDGLITDKFSFSSSRRNTFNGSFSQWLSDTHPDVFAETGFLVSSEGPGFVALDSTHMLVAVEYVEEFVAQSDIYPWDPADT